MLALLSNPLTLVAWAVIAGLCVAVLVRDLRGSNRGMMPVMKLVWTLTVAYSGPVGLAGYYWAGRRQIPEDTLARRGFRSVAHCYSGCGAGEIVGVMIAAGLLSLGNWWIAGITFALAYVAGYALSAVPLVQGGEALGTALWDALVSETASISVMEVTALAVDLWLSASASFSDPLFWSSLIISLSAGLAAAYPVNVILVRTGIKEGMHDPRQMAGGHSHSTGAAG